MGERERKYMGTTIEKFNREKIKMMWREVGGKSWRDVAGKKGLRRVNGRQAGC